jgi:hypothetical protein
VGVVHSGAMGNENRFGPAYRLGRSVNMVNGHGVTSVGVGQHRAQADSAQSILCGFRVDSEIRSLNLALVDSRCTGFKVDSVRIGKVDSCGFWRTHVDSVNLL